VHLYPRGAAGTVLRIHSVVGLTLLGASSGPATAADPEERAVSPDGPSHAIELLAIAGEKGPDLRQAQLALEATRGERDQAGRLANPSLGVTVDDLVLDDPDHRTEKIGLSQSVPISGRLGRARAVARARARAAALKVEVVRLDVLARIRKGLADLHAVEARRDTLERLLGSTREVHGVAVARFEAGSAPESHVVRALSEVIAREGALDDARRAVDRSRAALERIVGAPVDPGRAGFVEVLHPEEIAETVPGEHPRLLAHGARVAAARANVQRARAGRIPDLELEAAAGREKPSRIEFLELRIGVDLPIFDLRGGEIRATEADLRRHEVARAAARLDLDLELGEARDRLANLHARLDAIESRLAPAVDRGYRQALASYRAGRLSFLELVDALATLGEVRLQTIELERRRAHAAADVLALVDPIPFLDTTQEVTP